MEAGTAGNRAAPGAEVAYEAIAPVYDLFTAHHDYDLWLGNLVPKLEANGLTGRSLLDVACGTGKSFIPMLERGWRVTACDISAGMVEAARAKVGDAVDFSVHDMRELPKLGEFDLVWCLDDAVNYLLSQEELVRALRAMRENMRPGGLLMFDVNTIESYRTFFSEEVMLESGGSRMTWRGQSDGDPPYRSINEASFEIEALEPGAASSPPQMHRQRHFPEEDVRAALAEAGIEFIEVWGHHHDAIPKQPLSEDDHAKAVYFSRRPE